MVPKTKPKAKLRKCRYCRGEFYPRSTGGKEQHFCSEAHRKAFWKSGSLPFDKLVLRVERLVGSLLLDKMNTIELSQASAYQEIQREMAAIHSRLRALE